MHPLAVQFGAFTITWYGIMMATGFVVALWNAGRRAPFGGFHSEAIADLGPWLIVGGLMGARTLYVVTFWQQQFAAVPWTETLKIWHGGLVYYGGFAGGAAGAMIWSKWKRVSVWALGDVLAPSLALGYAFGRIGCLLNGCCYGRTCTLPWAITFPPPHQTYPGSVHPTQIYDALLALGLFAVLARLFCHRKFDGQVFVFYLFGYSVLRFSTEFFRGDYAPEQHYLGGWATPGQVASLLIFAAALVLWRLLPRKLQFELAPAGGIAEPVESEPRRG